ncbi:MAG: hypothetical protein ACRD3J_03910 [Thermoanaerobaculia bacterium]
MSYNEITVSRSELHAMAVTMSVAAGFCGLGVTLLLRQLLNMAPPLATGCAFVVVAVVWYPPARLLYRLRDYDLRLTRYTVVWFTIIVVVTALQFLVR